MRIDGDHAVLMRLAEVPQVQADLERTKTHFVQHDVIRGHAECVPFAVPVDVLELAVERREFKHDFVN